MNLHKYRQPLVTIILALWLTFPVNAVEINCHIHPNADKKEQDLNTNIIGPFTSESDCEAKRLQLFGNAGRCHCVYGFAFPGVPEEGNKTLPWSDNKKFNEPNLP